MRKYTLITFLAYKWPQLAITGAVVLAVLGSMYGLNLGNHYTFLVASTICLGELIKLVGEYLGDRSFFKQLEAMGKDGSSDTLLAILDEPHGLRARIARDALIEQLRQHQQRFNETYLEMQEYREFIETWVHEVKTPLAAARLLIENHPSEVSYELIQELTRTQVYVDEALFYARIGSFDRDFSIQRYSLDELVKDCIKSRMHMLIEADMHIEMESLSFEVLCDRKWVEFMVGQLIDNALKYRDTTKDCILRFEAIRTGDNTARQATSLSITDNGIGIKAADLPRITDKGFTGVNGRLCSRSTGIGLYLVSEMAHNMGIGLDITSQEGVFTTVTLEFRES